MSGPNGEKYQVVASPPRGAHWVRCPGCELRGWHTPDECGPPMVCPYCDVTGEHCGGDL